MDELLKPGISLYLYFPSAKAGSTAPLQFEEEPRF